MDAVSTLVSVCKVAISIKLWLEERKEKEKTLAEIASTVQRICDILSPFQAPAIATQLECNLIDSIRGIGDTLSRTKKHLIAWQENRTVRVAYFFWPAIATNQLREDERRLTNQLIITLFSMTVINFFRGRGSSGDTEIESLVLNSITNREVKELWRDYVGAKVVCVPGDKFSTAIKLWYRDEFGEDLNDSVCEHLLLCLDEFAIGGITSASLEDFVGSQSLKDTISQFKMMGNNSRLPRNSTESMNFPHRMQLPLIIWVDDNPDNNIMEVASARDQGITVIELPSTASAKAWIEANHDFLYENDNPNRIRFISDNSRHESDPRIGTFLNLSAGESLLRYLRGRFFTTPVLIYTGASIGVTEYVRKFEMAGSTTSLGVCMDYISALADGSVNDTAWKQYRA